MPSLINIVYAVSVVIAILGILFYLFRFNTRSEGRMRFELSITFFFLPFLIFIPYLLGQFFKYFGFYDYPSGEMGPGSGIVFLFPVVGAIVGYVLGLIIDLFKRQS